MTKVQDYISFCLLFALMTAMAYAFGHGLLAYICFFLFVSYGYIAIQEHNKIEIEKAFAREKAARDERLEQIRKAQEKEGL